MLDPYWISIQDNHSNDSDTSDIGIEYLFGIMQKVLADYNKRYQCASFKKDAK